MNHSTLVVYLHLKMVIAKKTCGCSVEDRDFRKDSHDSERGSYFPSLLFVRLNSQGSSLSTFCS